MNSIDACSTPMTQGNSGFTKALETSIAIAPMNRRGTPQEIADACLFLCSSKASFVQGHAMVRSPNYSRKKRAKYAQVIDGGYIIN